MSAPQQINVTGSDDDVARWIWKTLVPKSGQAEFVQAEVLRAVEKLRWEALNNGNINWDDRFKMLIDYIDKTLTSQACFSEVSRESIRDDLNRLRIADLPYVEDDLYDRLTSHLITFCRSHPQLIRHVADPHQYR
jgi:hypothetical protein